MNTESDEPGVAVTMPILLMLSGEYFYDRTTAREGRRNAGRVMEALLAVAREHGFALSGELRAMLQRIGHLASRNHSDPDFTREAVALAHAALDNVPGDAVRAALKRVNMEHILMR